MLMIFRKDVVMERWMQWRMDQSAQKEEQVILEITKRRFSLDRYYKQRKYKENIHTEENEKWCF